MNSSSAELNALTSTSVVDVYRRWRGGRADADAPALADRDRRDVWVSRGITIGWTAFAVGFAEYASRLGSLIEAVNIVGSLFYGTLLGIFLTAFTLPRVSGPAVCIAAVVAEAAVIACFRFTGISFLWYNVLGCAAVMLAASALTGLGVGRTPSPRRA